MHGQPSVIVVGGGPAGSISAILFARRGWRVTLVEQHRFPREKVCGECLSALGIDVLQRHGLALPVASRKPIALMRTLFHAQSGRSAHLELPSPMWGISRAAMDDVLLAEACRAGATLLQPARCEGISPMVTVRDLTTNSISSVASDFVIVADGKAAWANNKPPATSDLGIRAHFTNVRAPRDAIQLFGVNGHYGGVAPIEEGLFNVAFSIPAERVAEIGGDLDAMFEILLSENPSLAKQFRGASRTGNWLASPLPRFGVVNSWPDRVIPVGNAAAALEPIGGEGMGLAMRSAELASDALHDAVRRGRPVDWPRLRRSYEHLWRIRSFICRAAARMISSPRVADLSVDFVRASPPIADVMLAMAGKGRGARAEIARCQIP